MRVVLLLVVLAVSLVLTAADDAAVRLVNDVDDNSHAGRLEVLRDGDWGTVCDDGFGMTEATVVCRQLFGPLYTGIAYGNDDVHLYGEGGGRIWLDEVVCQGNEASISECNHNDWGDEDCGHHEDVAVSCTDGSAVVRLYSNYGLHSHAGRLEVRQRDGDWGTVCDNRFGMTEATVVCRQLGFGPLYTGIASLASLEYGEGYGDIWLDQVECLGNETSISECKHNGWGNHSCGNDEEVAVSCSREFNKLSFEPYTEITGMAMNASSVTFIVGNHRGVTTVSRCQELCNGRTECVFIKFEVDNEYCNLYGDGVFATLINVQQPQPSVSFWKTIKTAVRLVNDVDDNSHNGRLEVLRDGDWGTVCDNRFGMTEATVVCRQIFGPLYTGIAFVDMNHLYGMGDGHILLDNVECQGNENSISECNHNGWGIGNWCGHHQDVAVSCTDGSAEVRLKSNYYYSSHSHAGRLEVRQKNGTWGTVCDDHFGTTEATVVCRQIFGPLYTGIASLASTKYGEGYGDIWLDHVVCLGNETSISECKHYGWENHNCGHDEDVAVSCRALPAPSYEEITGMSITGRSSKFVVRGHAAIRTGSQCQNLCTANTDCVFIRHSEVKEYCKLFGEGVLATLKNVFYIGHSVRFWKKIKVECGGQMCDPDHCYGNCTKMCWNIDDSHNAWSACRTLCGDHECEEPQSKAERECKEHCRSNKKGCFVSCQKKLNPLGIYGDDVMKCKRNCLACWVDCKRRGDDPKTCSDECDSAYCLEDADCTGTCEDGICISDCEENLALDGHNTKWVYNVPTREACIQLCRDESTFDCLSIDYQYFDMMCALQIDSKYTIPDDYVPMNGWSYCTVKKN